MRRRIVSVALPWLVAEHRLRAEDRAGLDLPFAVVERAAGTLRLAGVNRAGAAAGLGPRMGLSDARAICPGLLTRPAAPETLAGFVRALCRWAERFSPLVGTDLGPSLALDATGVAHLFGGEAAMLDAITAALAERGLTTRAAIADTKGAAWALAHHGDAVATVAPPGQTRQAIGALPVSALRIELETAEGLATVGLTTIEPLTRMPRGALARRFGIETMRRLDQALGAEPEPVAPERPLPAFSARLTLPEPIGLVADVTAALEILLERLCARLETHRMGARRLCLVARRVDGADQRAEIRLARPGRDPMRLRDLFAPKLAGIDAGFGIDALRLAAPEVEPLNPVQLGRHQRESEAAKLADLVSRLGNRVGFENVIRFLPAESHAPERAVTLAAAAHSEPEPWPSTGRPPRPLTLFPPEKVIPAPLPGPPSRGGEEEAARRGGGARAPWQGTTDPLAVACGGCRTLDPDSPLPPCGLGRTLENPGRGEAGLARKGNGAAPPSAFTWRGRRLTTARAHGPERLAPEWWLDDPAWRSGLRDYWRVETAEGPRLWLFHTPADPAGPAWYAQGAFA
jgi:protein ImuB